MDKELFSFFTPPIDSTPIPTETLSLEEVYRRITTDRTLQENTEKIRTLLQLEGEDRYKEEKKRLLPSVTFTISPSPVSPWRISGTSSPETGVLESGLSLCPPQGTDSNWFASATPG